MNSASNIPTALFQIPAVTGRAYTIFPANKVDKVVFAPDENKITFNVGGHQLYLNPKSFDKALANVTNTLGGDKCKILDLNA